MRVTYTWGLNAVDPSPLSTIAIEETVALAMPIIVFKFEIYRFGSFFARCLEHYASNIF